MKAKFILSALVALGLFAACSKQGSPSSPGSSPSNTPAAPAGGIRTIDIQAGDNMRYDVTTIEAKPGEQIKVVLTNAGTMAKDIMGHNWVLLKADADPAAFAAAANTAKATAYIPEALKSQILAQIDLLGPKQTGEVTFTAPTQPGNYPYLCSFPAHYQVGMKGMLVVK